MVYEVATSVYTGPFDLLLHLIAKDEVDIYEVSLASIVDAYLAELERMRHVDLEVTTEFLLIAATLVELKSRRLLPGATGDDPDEELFAFERRDQLLVYLLACKTFKDAGAALAGLMRAAELSVPRTAGPEEPFASLAPDPLSRLRPEQLRAAALRALGARAAPPPINLDHVAPIRASVREAIDVVLAAVPRTGSITFRQLTSGIRDRIELVVRFLAVLELFKRGLVEIEQAGTFGELSVAYVPEGEREVIDLTDLDDWDERDASPPARAEVGVSPAAGGGGGGGSEPPAWGEDAR